MRTIRFAGISLILCLFIAFVLFTLSVHSAPANGVSCNRFKNSAPDPQAGGDNGLRNPADFEAALASRPADVRRDARVGIHSAQPPHAKTRDRMTSWES